MIQLKYISAPVSSALVSTEPPSSTQRLAIDVGMLQSARRTRTFSLTTFPFVTSSAPSGRIFDHSDSHAVNAFHEQECDFEQGPSDQVPRPKARKSEAHKLEAKEDR